MPTSSSTGTTLPGLEGFATSGTSAARSICSSSSKSPAAPVSRRRSPPRAPAPRARRASARRRGRLARRAELGDHVGDRAPLRVAKRGHAGPPELEHGAAPTAHPAAQELEDHVLGSCTHGRASSFSRWTPTILGQGSSNGCPAMQTATSNPPGADSDHRARARLGRVAVSADERLARDREALAVHVVADPVPRAREPRPDLRRHRLQEAVVVRILEVDLEDVVVDVDDRGLHLDALDAEPSNCISAIVPVASWASVWSTRSAISVPAEGPRERDALRGSSERARPSRMHLSRGRVQSRTLPILSRKNVAIAWFFLWLGVALLGLAGSCSCSGGGSGALKPASLTLSVALLPLPAIAQADLPGRQRVQRAAHTRRRAFVVVSIAAAAAAPRAGCSSAEPAGTRDPAREPRAAQAVHELEALRTIARLSSEGGTVQEVGGAILDAARPLVGADACVLLSLDHERTCRKRGGERYAGRLLAVVRVA